nr:T9SS type A sorting domain-containing protein [Bacteroidota bacterium]
VISGADAPSYTALESGTYQVDATNGTTSCSDTTIVTFNLPPVDTGFFELVLCDDVLNGSTDDDSISTFDLTVVETEITGGDTSVIVLWYASASDESSDIPILEPTQYQNVVNPQTIYYRVISSFGYYYVKEFFLSVVPLPSPVTPTPLTVCDADADGFSEFDLTSKDAEIANGEPDLIISYYETLEDAEVGDPANALFSPYVNIVPFGQVVYARVSNELIFNLPCSRIVELELMVANLPEEPSDDFVNPIIVVDSDGNGFETFNLTINDAAVLGTQDPAELFLEYYVSEIDAQTSQNPIAAPISFISSGQTIWVKLENLNTGCARITPFELVVQGLIIEDLPDDIFNNEGDGDGLSLFDLTVSEAQMLGDLNPSTHAFSYHLSLSDANNQLSPIDTPEAYQNLTNPQEIHVRMYNVSTQSYALASFQIETDGVLGNASEVAHTIVVFPNPVSNIVTVSTERPISEVHIYDMNGRKVQSFDHPDSTSVQFNIEFLSLGVYWLHLTSETQTVVKQLIKE